VRRGTHRELHRRREAVGVLHSLIQQDRLARQVLSLKMGPLALEFQGHGRIGALIAEDMRGLAGVAGGVPDVRLRFLPSMSAAEGIRAGDGAIYDETVEARMGNYRTRLTAGDAPWTADSVLDPLLAWRVASRAARIVPHTIQRWASPMWATVDERLSQGYIASVVLPVLAIALLRRDATLVRGCAFVHSEMATAIKGSALLAEDLVLLDAPGTAYPNPQPFPVDPRTVKGLSNWETAARKQGALQWRTDRRGLGERALTRWVSASSASRVLADRAPVRLAIWLERGGSQLVLERDTPERFAARATAVVAHDLPEVFEILLLADSFPDHHTALPTTSAFLARHRDTMEQALKTAEVWTLRVPRGVNAAAVAGMVREKLFV
jgi:hypothetical protein